MISASAVKELKLNIFKEFNLINSPPPLIWVFSTVSTVFTNPIKWMYLTFSYLDIVGYNGDIFEIQSCVYFIHHVERGRLVVMQSKNLRKNKTFIIKWKIEGIENRSPHSGTLLKSDFDKGVFRWSLRNKETMSKIKKLEIRPLHMVLVSLLLLNKMLSTGREFHSMFLRIFHIKVLLLAVWLDGWSNARIWLAVLETVISYETSCKKV